jgi:hypothetical protein
LFYLLRVAGHPAFRLEPALLGLASLRARRETQALEWKERPARTKTQALVLAVLKARREVAVKAPEVPKPELLNSQACCPS